MDLCEMLQCTMTELDTRVDAFEHAAWLNRWHESRFGSRWTGYYLAQIAGHAAHTFGGGRWYVNDYIVSSISSKDTEALSEQEEQSVAYEVMLAFGGEEKANLWRDANANN